jgi:fatty-acid peroxygenase
MTRDVLPRLPGDRSVQLIADAYRFVGRHADAFGTDGFRTRVMGQRVTCIRGASAARFFYEGQRFTRKGAVPLTVRHLLQDDGSVQTLDATPHLHRKQQFLDVLWTAEQQRMATVFDEVWAERAGARAGEPVDVLTESVRLLGGTVLRWAGVPLETDDPDTVTDELHMMVRNAGRFGVRNSLARKRRMLTEHRARRWIERARAGEGEPGTPLGRVAAWTDEQGEALPAKIAAIELLNLLRPTVAVAEFFVYAALVLAVRPATRALVLERPGYARALATEVRRRAPFFPVIAGRATADLEWQGQTFAPHDWVMLDLYGTNHDARLWPEPRRFRPERFLDEGASPLHVVAQGAGEYGPDHRCPGEPLTDVLLERFAQKLAAADWRPMGAVDARIRYSSIPALPRTPLALRFAA